MGVFLGEKENEDFILTHSIKLSCERFSHGVVCFLILEPKVTWQRRKSVKTGERCGLPVILEALP